LTPYFTMKKFVFFVAFLLLAPTLIAQINLGGIMKEKAGELKDKLKDKAKDKTNEYLEKQRHEYDESNFNYAISFVDNSGVFEAEEKGNAFASDILSGSKFLKQEEKTTEDRAYTNLKNGELLMAGNKFYMAEQSFRLSKLLYEQEQKTNDPNYAQVLSNLGLLYQSRGRYNKAAVLNAQALELREKTDNKGMLLVSVNNAAVLKKETGNYTEAEKEFKKAQQLAETLNDNLAKALVGNNLAMNWLAMNKLKEAEGLMLQSIGDASKALKENSSNFIKLKINLAGIYREQKKYNLAEDIYIKAIAAKEKKLGTHPDLAHLKRGLAQLYMEMGKNQEVEKLLSDAYQINKSKLGENNPATLAVQQELANYYRFSGMPQRALELMLSVVTAKKSIYSETHPGYVQALEDLALAQWANAKVSDCRLNYNLVIKNTLAYIEGFFSALNESEKTAYWEKTNTRLQRYYSFVVSQLSKDPEALKEFYNTTINTKGFLLNNSSKIRNAIFSGSDEGLKYTFSQWLETKELLNHAYQLSRQEQAQEKVNFDSLKGRANELERELSAKSALFKESSQVKQVSFAEIQKALNPNECAVEVVEVSNYNNGFTGVEKYVALLLSPSGLKQVELGEGSTIEKAIAGFRQKVINRQPENEAYAALWKNIDTQLGSPARVYVSLDGAYHQLSLMALKDAAGKYLVDKYELVFVGNTRDVINVKQSEVRREKPQSAFLLGNPLYGQNEVIEQLPGTEKEVTTIAKLLKSLNVKTETSLGKEATEARLKRLASPTVLHIATHGYFLNDVSQLETKKVLGVDIDAAAENPLLRSGLLLAGCENVFDENYRAPLTSENGVVTAYEALSLNLDKTDLVVLSACETGLGSVKQGEGVYGLQRAFLIAGAKSIVMSLWSVSDEATMELMIEFYANYAKSGNKAQAFSAAIKQLKLKHKDPFFWSPFVMLQR